MTDLHDGGSMTDKTGFQVVDDWLYVKGSDYVHHTFYNRVLRIDLVDGQPEEMLTDVEVEQFDVSDTHLSYNDLEQVLLYKKDLEVGTVEVLTTEPSEAFQVMGDNVYSLNREEEKLKILDDEGKYVTLVDDYPVSGYSANYGFVAIHSLDSSDYGLVVVNSEGRTVFKTSQHVLSYHLLDGVMNYRTAEDVIYEVMLTAE